MPKTDILKNIIKTLEKSEYVICEYNGCFDIAAKKDKLLLLKVLQNVDSFSEEQAKNLKIIANNLDAVIILIGENTTREKLKPGIVYERFELPAISPETLKSLIVYEIFPKIYRDRGGLYVEIDSDTLKECRQNKKLTQRELAEMVGINKKAIYEHEKCQLRMTLDIAQKLEHVLNKKITKPIDLTKNLYHKIETGPKNTLEKQVGYNLKKIGFKIDYVRQAPFDVFAKEKTLVISDVEENKRKMQKRASELKEFVKTAERPAIMITEEIKEEDIKGIPIVRRKELVNMRSKDLIKLARKIKE